METFLAFSTAVSTAEGTEGRKPKLKRRGKLERCASLGQERHSEVLLSALFMAKGLIPKDRWRREEKTAQLGVFRQCPRDALHVLITSQQEDGQDLANLDMRLNATYLAFSKQTPQNHSKQPLHPESGRTRPAEPLLRRRSAC